MILKNLLKITSFMLIGLSSIGTLASASPSVSNSSMSTEQKIFLSSLPEEQVDLLTSSNDKELVDEQYSFHKMVVKDESKHKRNLSESDYELVPSNLTEFLLSQNINENTLKSLRIQLAPGVWTEDDFDNPVVMHGIFVERYTNNNRLFSCRSSFTWSRRPYINATDAVGITCHPSMTMLIDSASTYGEAFISMPNGSGGTQTYKENIIVGKPILDPNGIGVAVAVKPLGSAYANTGYIQADAMFTNTKDDVGAITSEYLSTTLKFGTLTFDHKGRPSFGFNVLEDRFSQGVNVTKYN